MQIETDHTPTFEIQTTLLCVPKSKSTHILQINAPIGLHSFRHRLFNLRKHVQLSVGNNKQQANRNTDKLAKK